MLVFVGLVGIIVFIRFLPMMTRIALHRLRRCRRRALVSAEPQVEVQAEETNPKHFKTIDLMVFDFMPPPPDFMEKLEAGLLPRNHEKCIGSRIPKTDDSMEVCISELYGSASINMCCICLSDYSHGDKCARTSNCEHIWHQDCIQVWITKGNWSCPLCRASLLSPDPVSRVTEAPVNPERLITGSRRVQRGGSEGRFSLGRMSTTASLPPTGHHDQHPY